jgi:acylglycerol lipase
MIEDPLNYTGRHVSGTAMEIVNTMRNIRKNYNRLETPYLLFQGGRDKVVDPFACVDLENESPSKDKTTVIYKEMWHEIPYEPEYEEICHLSAKWLKLRVVTD